MNTKIKDVLGISLIAGIIAMTMASVSYVMVYSKTTYPSAQISVNAQGKVMAKPDIAEFTYSVITEGGNDLGNLQKKNSQDAGQVLKYVRESGVNENDIRTAGFNVDPRYDTNACPNPLQASDATVSCPPPKIVGYTVTESVVVKIRDFDKISSILSGITNKGVDRVSELSFKVDDATLLQDQAREQAIQKAREKAVTLSKSANFRLGRLLSISEYSPSPLDYYDGKGGGGFRLGPEVVVADGDIARTIEPGTQEVVVDVTLNYEIR